MVRSDALIQTQISGGTSGVDGENVNEIQEAVMQWELTFVEHESKFSEMVADKRKNNRATCASQRCAQEIRQWTFPVWRTSKSRVCTGGRDAGWTRREQWSPTHGHSTDRQSEGEDEDVNAQLRRPRDQSNQKHKQESDNERNLFIRRIANSSPSASRSSTPRDKKSGSDETKQSAGKKKRPTSHKCGGKGHPARFCPSADELSGRG